MLRLIGIVMFGAKFNLVARAGTGCWITVNFGTMKDEGLYIIFFSIEQLFVSQEPLPKWRQHFLKNGLSFFAKKLKILYILYHVILFEFHQHVVQILIK